MSEALHQNFLSAKTMVEQSMQAPTKTVKYLPMFSRVYPQNVVDKYKNDVVSKVLGNLKNNYCLDACLGQGETCRRQCSDFYDSALQHGLNVIHKVHKPYKVQTIEDDDE